MRVISKSDERAFLHDAKFNYYFYYSHFEIAEFSQYQYIIHLVAGLLFIFWTETMRYTAVANSLIHE